MNDEFELELSDDEFSELKRVSSLLGISPEEGAVMALREYVRKFEAEQRTQLGEAEPDVHPSEFETRLQEFVAEDENILRRLADEAE